MWDTVPKKTLALAVVVYATTSGEIWLNANGSQYYAALVTVLILCEPTSGLSRHRAWTYRALLAVNGLNGTLSALIAPLYWLKAWRTGQREAVVQAVLLTAAGLVQFAAILTAGLLQVGRTDVATLPALGMIVGIKGLIMPFDLATAHHVYEIVCDDVAEGRFDAAGYAFLAMAALLLSALTYRLRSTPAVYLPAAFALLIVAASEFGLGGEGHYALMHVFSGSRYFFAPAAILLLALLAAVCPGAAWRGSAA